MTTLQFMWTSPADQLLNICIENTEQSSIPGDCGPGIFELTSPNISIQGVTLTIYFFGNEVNPNLPPAINGLIVENVTIIASTVINVLGTLSFVLQYSNTEAVTTLPSIVTSTSGIFTSCLLANVLTTYENTTNNPGNRAIRIFPAFREKLFFLKDTREIALKKQDMPVSPLVFTYNEPKSQELGNDFKNEVESPRKGLTSAFLYDLQSSNLNVSNLTLTLLIYSNVVIPKNPKNGTNAKTSLEVESMTIVATSISNTVGILTYTLQYQNPYDSNNNPTTTTLIPKTSSFVNSASGIFVDYLLGNVITTYDSKTGERIISIYSAI